MSHTGLHGRRVAAPGRLRGDFGRAQGISIGGRSCKGRQPFHLGRALAKALGRQPGGSGQSNCFIEIRTPAWSLDVVDTTGAGDAFIGGLAYGILKGFPLKRMFATACQRDFSRTLNGVPNISAKSYFRTRNIQQVQHTVLGHRRGVDAMILVPGSASHHHSGSLLFVTLRCQITINNNQLATDNVTGIQET